MTKNRIQLVCAAALLFSFGCGRGDLPELAPVTGTVTLDGTPFPNAVVYFHTQSKEGGT